MPKLLKARDFAIDAWQRFDGDAARIARGDALLFPLPVWLAQRDTLLAREASRTGSLGTSRHSRSAGSRARRQQ